MFKKIFIVLVAGFILAQYIGVSHGASSDSDSSESYLDQYKEAKKFVERAKKLEEKNKYIGRSDKKRSPAVPSFTRLC